MSGQFRDKRTRFFAVVQNAVDRFGNRHLDVEFLVDLCDAFARVVTFGYHVHLHLRRLYRVAFADHQSEPAVAAELGVGSYQQVAQVGRCESVSLGRVGLFHKTRHLHGTVGDQYREEIVAVTEADADTYRDGIDVFQNRSIFRTVNIGRMADVDVRGADLFTEGERIFHLFADHGQVREPLEGHLFGVARSADDAQLVERDAVAAVTVT